MPDSKTFQPTTETYVRCWRVCIERAGGREIGAERLTEISVRGMAVDCSASGEPFCVVFWPDFHPDDSVGGKEVQLEVLLGGLRGPTTELSFFFEVARFLSRPLNTCFLAEAARLQAQLGEATLWSREPTNREAASPRSAASDTSRTGLPVLERVSHPMESFTSQQVDITITLRGPEIAALQAELHIMRFGDEEELMPRACQVQRLVGGFFWVRAKLPMARCRYEIHFFSCSHDTPSQLQQHPLKYSITAGEHCHSLISSLEDPLVRKYGYAIVSHLAHLHSVMVLAPLAYRVPLGCCYFLIHLDAAALLSAAAAATAATRGPVEPAAGPKRPVPPSSTLFSRRLGVGGSTTLSTSPDREDEATPPDVVAAWAEDEPPEVARKKRLSAPPKSQTKAQPGLVTELHGRLKRVLEAQAQDSGRDAVHLDVVLQSGECPARLRERPDLPGYYEGMVTFVEADANTLVQLRLRTPALHAAAFVPRVLCEWLVCRQESLPANF